MTHATPTRVVAAPRVCIVIPHWNTPDRLDRCLASLPEGCADVPYEIVVVDNASAPGARPAGASAAGHKLVVNDRNVGFATACNQGAAAATAPMLLFLNSDAVLDPDCVRHLTATLASDEDLGVVAPLQRAGPGRFRSPARAFLGPLSQAAALVGVRRARCPLREPACAVERVPWVTGAALLVSASLFRRLGGFDEGYFFYEEDEDLCWRLRRRGYAVGIVAAATIRHTGGASVRLAGEWPTRALYAGQLRFVTRRYGRAGRFSYRVAVAAAAIAKAMAAVSGSPCDVRRLDTALRIFEAVWKGGTAVVTKAG